MDERSQQPYRVRPNRYSYAGVIGGGIACSLLFGGLSLAFVTVRYDWISVLLIWIFVGYFVLGAATLSITLTPDGLTYGSLFKRGCIPYTTIRRIVVQIKAAGRGTLRYFLVLEDANGQKLLRLDMTLLGRPQIVSLADRLIELIPEAAVDTNVRTLVPRPVSQE